MKFFASFKIVVPSFNSVNYIEKTLQSIEKQTYRNFSVCVIDDCSTIDQQREIIAKYCQKNGWNYFFNSTNQGALHSIVRAIEELKCKDDDIIVIVDGDDWLSSDRVLEKVAQVYEESHALLTWGQCQVYPAGKTSMKYAQPIPDMVIEQKLYRKIPFVFWHLHTFKYFLWRHVKDEDLRDIDGNYFRIMYDKAILFPMLEMAGKKIRFIDEVLYIYNIENPLNDFALTPEQEHVRVDAYIRAKPVYKEI